MTEEELNNPEYDPVPQLESYFPSLSCPIRSLFHHSTSQPPQFFHNQKYFWFSQSCANLGDDEVIKLTAKLKCCVKCNYSYARTLMQCSKYISQVEGASKYFALFLEVLCPSKVQNDIIHLSKTRSISKRTLEQIKQLQFKKQKLQKPISVISNNIPQSTLNKTSFTHISHEMDDCSEPPTFVPLRNFIGRKIPSEKDPHVTISYVKQSTVLQRNIADALLFNSQYVSLFSGSEGGSNTDQSGKDEQLIIDQEDYFLATHYIPDAQVIVNRIEKTIFFLTQEEDPYQNFLFPGFLISAIRDVYGPEDSYTIFKALKINREKTKEVILPRLIEARNNYYSKEREWNEFHAYENSLFGMQMVMKKEEIDLSIPDSIEYNENELNVLSTFLLACAELYFSSRSNDQIFSIQKNIVTFFDILTKLTQSKSDEKNIFYVPFIVVSALKLIPAIIESLNSFEKTLEPHIFEDYKTKYLFNLEITQAELRGLPSSNLSVLDKFLITEATNAMRLIAMHFSYMKSIKSGKYDLVIFGNIIGQTLLHRIMSFVCIFEMCDIRNDFLPLADLYYQYNDSKFPLDKYLEMSRKICPIRGLYSIIKRENETIFDIDIVHQNVVIPLSLPVIFLPSPTSEETNQ